MASLLYYLPKRNRLTLDLAGEVDLAYAFDEPIRSVECSHGPNNEPAGCVVCQRDPPGLKPDAQTWREIPGTDRLVGYWNAAKPTPADLARASLVHGHDVELADGKTWHVPAAVSWDGSGDGQYSNHLPQMMELDAEGNPYLGRIADRHQPLWEAFQAFAAWQTERETGKQTTYSDADLLRLAGQAIGTNYRVSLVELWLLEAISTECLPGVVNAVGDYPTYLDWEEKKSALALGGLRLEGGQTA